MTIEARGGEPGFWSAGSAGGPATRSVAMTSGRGTFHGLPDRGDHVGGVLVGHRGEERQGDDPRADLLGHPEGPGLGAEMLPVVGVEVDRLEVEAGADPQALETVHELRPVGSEHGEEVPGVDLLVVAEAGKLEAGQAGEL